MTAHQAEAVEQWLTVQQACALIGVAPATLRRWSVAGDVPAFTTPGGHRRFARSTILGLLPSAGQERPDLERMGETAEQVVGQTESSATEGGQGSAGTVETVEIFLRLRELLLTELVATARRRGLDVVATTDLLTTAHRAVDQVHVALIGGLQAHGANTAPTRGST